jgi:hypothetical protein
MIAQVKQLRQTWGLKTRILSKLVDRIFYESRARARKERSRSERDAASLGGIFLFITSACLPSAMAFLRYTKSQVEWPGLFLYIQAEVL